MPEQKVSEICQTCKFWKCHEWQRIGDAQWSHAECSFNAPVYSTDSNGIGVTKWPRTEGTDFCGQWQQCEK